MKSKPVPNQSSQTEFDRLLDFVFPFYTKQLSDNDNMPDRGSDPERLSQAGTDVRIDCSPEHMHHKFMVIAGRTVMNGSYNWTRSAETRHEEHIIAVDDPRLAHRFPEEFERIWKLSEPASS